MAECNEFGHFSGSANGRSAVDSTQRFAFYAVYDGRTQDPRLDVASRCAVVHFLLPLRSAQCNLPLPSGFVSFWAPSGQFWAPFDVDLSSEIFRSAGTNAGCRGSKMISKVVATTSRVGGRRRRRCSGLT